MAEFMQAMAMQAPGADLVAVSLPVPRPAAGQVLVRVSACGVCRTDLHLRDAELPGIVYPRVPGHEIVGTAVACGADVGPTRIRPGTRVGIPWLGHTCGTCAYCTAGRENLCDAAAFTGYTVDGGYAEYCLADARYCFPLPAALDDVASAPLMCAGLIGYRALGMCGDAARLGLMGFGAAAHLVAQIARWQGREVYAFTRPGDAAAQDFARALGAVWAGPSTAAPPVALDAVIIFAPVGALVPLALAAVRKGGRVVCGGIHMSDLPSFPYALLWGERSLLSVANLTRADGQALLEIAAAVPLVPTVQRYPLVEANLALADLRAGRLSGAAVLECA
jgi:alcohol dehydrogenase, propanol-preferring